MANIEISTLTRNNDGNTYIIKDANAIPKTGSNQISGDLIPTTTDAYGLGDSSHNYKIVYAKEIRYGLNSSVLLLSGGKGANIELYGSNASSYAGWVSIKAVDNNGQYQMILKPDGTLKWGSKNVAMAEDVIPRSGGAVITGDNLSRTVDNSDLTLNGGTAFNKGASLSLYGENRTGAEGAVIINLKTGSYAAFMYLSPTGTWTWNGTACQITSDQRLKQQISQIDDDLLTAWEDVNLVQFKYNDAVKEKSDNARLHTGYVVQQIDDACKKHNVDVSKYGLYCHEVYQEETREVEQADGTKTTEVVRPANEHYSLRYTEALIVECAYLRKCIKELRAEIEELRNCP